MFIVGFTFGGKSSVILITRWPNTSQKQLTGGKIYSDLWIQRISVHRGRESAGEEQFKLEHQHEVISHPKAELWGPEPEMGMTSKGPPLVI